ALGPSPWPISCPGSEPRRRDMKAYVLIETAAGKTKQVKKTLTKVKSARASVSAMDAVTGPYDFIAVVEGQTLDAIGSLVTDAIGIIDGVTRTTTCVAVTVGGAKPEEDSLCHVLRLSAWPSPPSPRC